MPMNPRLLRPLASGFNPRSIAGLALWIDFADTATVTLDGSNKISAVTDKSASGLNGAQTTSGSRLGVSTLNGRQCADNGTASNTFGVFYSAGANVNNWRHSFVVAVWDAGGTTFPEFNSFFSASASSGTAAGLLMAGAAGTGNLIVNTGAMHGPGSRWRFNGGSYTFGDRAFPYFGGTPFVMNGDAQTDYAVNGWNVGGDRQAIGRGWRGRIAEVLSFNRSLSDSEASRIEGYLAWKWGLQAQLPYDHPYAKSFPGYGSQAVPTDADTLTYLAAVKAADGTGVEVGVANAVDAFVTGCKSDGIWDAIKASCILAGARTLSGALVPLRGSAPTNNGPFVSGDYDRKTGLVGNGTSKRLETGYLNEVAEWTNRHDAVFVHTANTAANGRYYNSTTANPSNFIEVDTVNNNLLLRAFISGQITISGQGNATGFIGVRRIADNNFAYRVAGTTTANAAAVAAVGAGPPAATPLCWFGIAGGTRLINGRMQFASAGYALDLALLDTRVSALIAAIGAAI
jgi:hypothetical protein